jgi:hypothetical protein
MMDRRLVLGAMAALAATPAFAQQSREQVAAGLNGQNPAAYYQSAMTLFRAGQRDDATFIFYLGQLRYRTHLRARPDLKPDGDPALFGSLSEVVGRPINEWAFGDMPAALRTLDAVLAYDARDPDRFTPPGQFKAAHDSTREGMRGFRRQMEAQAQDIKRQRAANGLENRW